MPEHSGTCVLKTSELDWLPGAGGHGAPKQGQPEPALPMGETQRETLNPFLEVLHLLPRGWVDLVSFVVVVVSLKTETSGAGDHTQINYKISSTFSSGPAASPRPCN